MTIIGSICIGIGGIVGLIYGIKLIIIAFQKSILWGLAYIFVPMAALVFVIMHWDKTKSPFLKSLIAIPLIIGGGLLKGYTGGM